jgi:glucokinase
VGFFWQDFMIKHANSLAIIADIGGTNARFALADISKAQIELSHKKTLATVDFASLQHAVEHYLDLVDVKPKLASIR